MCTLQKSQVLKECLEALKNFKKKKESIFKKERKKPDTKPVV